MRPQVLMSALPPKADIGVTHLQDYYVPAYLVVILGLKDVKLSLKAAEIGERHLIKPCPAIATKDLAVVARMIKNSFKS